MRAFPSPLWGGVRGGGGAGGTAALYPAPPPPPTPPHKLERSRASPRSPGEERRATFEWERTRAEMCECANLCGGGSSARFPKSLSQEPLEIHPIAALQRKNLPRIVRRRHVEA
ncbi:hypothetical protein F1D61_32065 [Methylobacterium aquaticum]|nr:hypothetical protein F1D61_32065 [Methylobacterium aquaticum]